MLGRVGAAGVEESVQAITHIIIRVIMNAGLFMTSVQQSLSNQQSGAATRNFKRSPPSAGNPGQADESIQLKA